MAEFKTVIADPKEKKAYQKVLENKTLFSETVVLVLSTKTSQFVSCFSVATRFHLSIFFDLIQLIKLQSQ